MPALARLVERAVSGGVPGAIAGPSLRRKIGLSRATSLRELLQDHLLVRSRRPLRQRRAMDIYRGARKRIASDTAFHALLRISARLRACCADGLPRPESGLSPATRRNPERQLFRSLSVQITLKVANLGRFLKPAKIFLVQPHAMEQNSEAARHRYNRLLSSPAHRNLFTPLLQPGRS